MKHFVAYHNTQRMGQEFGAAVALRFQSKKLASVKSSVGNRIWVIQGDRKGAKMAFSLRAAYVGKSVKSIGDNTYVITGNRTVKFAPPLLVNDFEWFRDLYKAQNNFSFGFNQIGDDTVIAALNALEVEAASDDGGSSSFQRDVAEREIDADPRCRDISITTRDALVEARIGQGGKADARHLGRTVCSHQLSDQDCIDRVACQGVVVGDNYHDRSCCLTPSSARKQFDTFDLARRFHFAQHSGNVDAKLAVLQQLGGLRTDSLQQSGFAHDRACVHVQSLGQSLGRHPALDGALDHQVFLNRRDTVDSAVIRI